MDNQLENREDRFVIGNSGESQLFKARTVATGTLSGDNKTLTKLFEEQCFKTPDSIAIVFGQSAFTYGELNERSNKLARYLQGKGVTEEVLVPICMNRSLEMIVGILGIMKAGGAYVPIDVNFPIERIIYILSDIGANLMLGGGDIMTSLEGRLPVNVVNIQRDWDEIAVESGENLQTRLQPSILAYVLYTSGTTGLPKGVMVEQRHVVRMFSETTGRFHFTSGDVWTLWHPYVFDISVWEMWGSLLHGGRLVLVGEEQRRDPKLFYEICKHHGVTVLNLTPSAFFPWMEVAVGQRERLETLRYIILCGEALHPGQLRPWFDRYGEQGPQVINAYGPTETTVHMTYQEFGLKELDGGSLIGSPIPDMIVFVLDANQMPVPIGIVGELYIGGAGVTRGYLNQPELTAERFLSNPFQTPSERNKGINDKLYRTGDLVRWQEDGNLEYIGRIDLQVKLRGYRIELGEIESRLSSYPGVLHSVVLVKGIESGNPYLVGYYVGREAIGEEELLQYLREGLPEYMVPSVLMRLQKMPLTGNGKLDRKALPEPDLSVMKERYEAPADELERKLCDIYGKVFGLKEEEIGVTDDFFRLGGNSILAMRLVSRINRELGTAIGVTAILIHRTIRQLCAHIREGISGEVKICAAAVNTVEEQALSFAQERLWFVQAFEGGSRAYNIPLAVRLVENVEVESVVSALRSVVHRHEVLRTLIRTNEAGVGYQQVMNDGEMLLEIPRMALSSEEALKAELQREANGLFRLDREYPIRVKLYQVEGEENWYLSIVLHHIAFDEWSGDIFLRELEQGYRYQEAVRLGAWEKASGLELPAPVLQYREFALWQRKYLTGAVLERQVGYWREKLAGYEPMRLATDYQRPLQVNYGGATICFGLNNEVSAGLREVARDLEVSLFSVLLSGYYVLLSAYSDQKDIVVGSAVTNRHYGELSGLIGFFVNMLAMREQVEADQEVAAFIKQVGRTVLEAQLHQDLSFEKLVEELEIEQDPSRHPVFQVSFNLQQTLGSEAVDAGGEKRVWTQYGSDHRLRVAKFDLSVTMEEQGEQIKGEFNYATSLFKEETIRWYVNTYQEILGQISNLLAEAAVRRKRIGELGYLSSVQYKEVVNEWNQTAAAYPLHKTIQGLFEEQVERTPDTIAVVFEGIELTYKELNERSNQLANYLLEQYNIQPDDLVCLCMNRSEQLLIAILGVLKAGGAYVPLDPSTPEERLEYIIEDTGTKVVLRGCLPEVSGYPDFNPQTKTGAGNLAYVIYTSGTTGRPKGVMVEQRGVVNYLFNVRAFIGEEINRVDLSGNVAFDMAVTTTLFPLCFGKMIYIYAGDITNISDYEQHLIQNRIELLKATPGYLSVLAHQVDGRNEFALKVIIAGGEKLHGRQINSLLNLTETIIDEYGPTETTVGATAYMINKEVDQYSIGKAYANYTVYVLSKENKVLPVGAVGELYIGGAGVARGYLNQAALTAERFVVNPFQTDEEKRMGINDRLYRTGDLVRWLANGNLEYLGRNDQQVKLRGYRIELGEIESRLSSYPGVRQCVVVMKGNDSAHPYLAGYYVSASALAQEELLTYLESALPEYMVPSVLVWMEELPLTVNGKLDRKALPEPGLPVIGERYERPGDELERKLCSIYAEVLGLKVEKIGMNDDFSRLGGDSIVSIRLVSRINKELGTRIRVTAIFLHRTIRQLGVHIREGISGEVRISAPAVNTVEEQTLSFAQERLWFIESYEGGSRAYNIQIAVQLSENMEVESVVSALRSVVHRHEVLRTLIRTNEAGVGYQQVMDYAEMPLEIRRVELSSEEALQAELQREAGGIFQLDREYPIRVTLYQLEGKTGWYLSIVLHHIAFDEWSGDIFLRELEQGYWYYEALRLKKWDKARRLELPAPVLQYREFALWQRGYLTGEVLERQVGYWRKKLAGYEPLRLATDRVRPPQVSYVGATVYFELDPEVSEGLRQVARELEVSLYSVLLSGYYVLLSAYSNQTDIIVGSAVTNRHYGELSGLIGFFVNTLAMREQVVATQALEAFIRQVGRSVLQAQLNQDLPFEKLVEELGVEQDPSRHPVYQVNLGFAQEVRRAGGAADGGEKLWQLYGEGIGRGVAKLDLSVMIQERDGQLRGTFNYATSLFDEGTIRSYVETYRQILDQISNLLKEAAGRSKRIVELQYLGVREQERLLGEWKGKTFAYSSNKTIQALFEEQVERTPDNIAVVYEGVKLTYKELNEQSNQLANYLLEQYNIQPDELVCLCLDRSEQQLIGMLGVLKSGGAYVPIDPATPEERLAYIIQDTGSKVVLRGGLPQVSGYATINPQTKTGANDLAYVIYTSGTTGRPKGVMVEHRGVVNLAMMQALEYGLKINERTVYHQNCLWYSNYVFDAHVWEIYTTLIHGHSLYIIDNGRRTDIRLLQEYIREHAITIATIPPAVLDTDHILGLKILTAAGEITSSRIMERYVKQQVNIINAYGPTETTVCATCHYYQAGNSNREIGRPLPNITVYVLDGDCRPLPVGAVGELYVGGAGVARGYLNQAELTAERFVANRFQTEEEKRLGINARLYRTGDLVRWLSNGSLEYIGRNDHQVKLRGYRIELGEIESRLSLYPGVQQSVVVKIEAGGHPTLAGYYVAEEAISEEALLQYLRVGLPEYMIPSVLIRLEKLPVTVNGKLDRKALPDPVLSGTGEGYEGPENELERKLCSIYGEVLGLKAENIGVNDDFFRLGGDSIVSIQLVSRIHQQLGIWVEVGDIFMYRTVRELCRQVIAGAVGERRELIVEEGLLEGESGLLPIQQWFFEGIDQGMYQHYNHFNHSFLIDVPRLNREILEESIRKLAEHHDSLRFSYVREEVEGRNVYRQYYRRELEGITLRYVHRSELAGAEALSAVLTEWQSDFNIFGGKLWQAGYVEGYEGNRARVFFAIHHLLIDTVSWRILTEDLQRIYEYLATAERGREWKLIPAGEILGKKGSSYRQWVEAGKEYKSADAAARESEEKYWRKVVAGIHQRTGLLSAWDTGEESQSVLVLEKGTTTALLQHSGRVFGTQINDLLLSGLVLALREVTGEDRHAIVLEGHGREAFRSDIDITHTIGWFTSQYPVLLSAEVEDIGKVIVSVKEELRGVKDNGIGYGFLIGYEEGLPQIGFNYLGQFQGGEGTGDRWQIRGEDAGISSLTGNRDRSVLTINGAVVEGKLSFRLCGRLGTEVTSALTESYRLKLEGMIAWLSAEKRSYLTGSDIGNIISKEYLNKLQAEREVEGVYLANSLQQGFIYHVLHRSEDDAYRVQTLWGYRTGVEVERLKEAWIYAQRKYPSLRLRFGWEEELVQVIDREGELDWRYSDIGEMGAEEQAGWINELMEKDRRLEYDLSKGNLFRVYVVKLGPAHYVSLVSHHHAILDGWSGPVLLGYVHECYLKLCRGEEVKVEADSTYLHVQRYLQVQREENQAFWNGYIDQLEGREDLRGWLKRGKEDTVLVDYRHIQEAKELSVGIGAAQYGKLKAYVAEEGLTVNTVLQYLWHKQLSVYGGERVTAVGMTVSGRQLSIEGIDESVGLYINTLPVILAHKEGLVLESIKELKEHITDINSRSEISLSKLQRRGRPFSTLFVYENYPVPEDVASSFGKGDELGLYFRGSVDKADYPLGLVAYEWGGEVTLRLRYAGELFEEAMMGQVLGGMQRMLDQLLQDRGLHTSELHYLGESEQEQLLGEWKGREIAYPSNKTIQALFEEQVDRTPENIAVVYEGVELTYKELNERSNQLANYLLEQYNIQPDELVCLCMNRSEQLLIAILGVLKAGGAYVPVDPATPEERLAYIIQDTGSKVVLRGGLPEVRDYAIINPQTKTGVNDLAYVIYTSGTTGRPKGVMVEHQGVVNLALIQGGAFGLGEPNMYRRCLWYSNYVFDAHVSELFTALVNGHAIYIASENTRTDLALLGGYILQNKIDIATIPPVLLDKDRLLRLGTLVVAGDVTGSQIMQAYNEQGTAVINAYGPTEATVCATLHPYRRGDLATNIGRPIANTTVYVLDGERRMLPVGAVGELYIGGAGVARGYLNQPALTSERFVPNPFQTSAERNKGVNDILYRTGDLVRWLANGNLEYLGRNDQQVKLRGYRIEPGEIESRLSLYPGVRQSVIVLKGTEGGHPYLAGYYVSTEEISQEDLLSYLESKLPGYMVPSVLMRIEELPLTVNGKLDRRALPEPVLSAKGNNDRGAENELERKLCGIYGEVLGLHAEKIGVNDDFFRLGGNSILAIQVINGVNEALGIELEVADIFTYTTVRQLGAFLREGITGRVKISAVATNTEEEQALSFAQERLWFIENYEGGSPAYNIPMAVRLSGNMEVNSVELALRLVVHRHEVLRTLILTNETGLGYQQVMNDEKMPLEIGRLKLSSQQELQAALQRDASGIFKLDREYPIRLKLYQVEEEGWYLSIVLHHIAFDEWSGNIFLQELEQGYRYYEAIRLQQPEKAKGLELPMPVLQYREFALWQRGYLTGEVLERQVRYWQEKLLGYEPLRLSTDRVRPLQVSHEGATIPFELSREVSEGLRGVARELEVSLYSVLLSGYYVLLSVYSNQKDIIVGSAVANRQYGELSEVIGFFVNMLAMRGRVEGGQEVAAFIRQVGRAVVEAQLHQDLPFEKLVEELEVAQDPSRHPVFQVTFGLQQGNKGANGGEELWQRYGGGGGPRTAKFDLSVMMEEQGAQLKGVFNYATGLFDKETIWSYVETYREILVQIGNLLKDNAGRSKRIGELRYLGEQEKAQLLGERNDRAIKYPPNRTIKSLFEEQAARTPDTIAVVYEGTALTYKELNERSNQLAYYLQEQYNIQPDELVCLCLDRSEQLLIAILGVLKAGGAYVPIDPATPEEWQAYIVQDTKAKVVLRGGLPEVLGYAGVNLQTKAGADNLAYVIYTSGTTGRPKGVMVENKALIDYSYGVRAKTNIAGCKSFGLVSTTAADLGYTVVFTSLLIGGTLHIFSDQEVKDPVKMVNTGLDCLKIVPSHWKALQEQGRFFAPGKCLIFGGEALTDDIIQFIRSNNYTGEVYNHYGPTETTVGKLIKRIDLSASDKEISLGYPIGESQVYIVDEHCNLLPNGAIGEIAIQSAGGLARGYLNLPELTAKKFIPSPFKPGVRLYRTGDLGKRLFDGSIVFLGRNDQQVKLRGYRIELGEIESRLSSYPGVRQSVVVVKGETGDHPYLVGYYVSEKETDEETLLQYLRVSLPDYMVPSVLMRLEELPLTANGKLDRKALPDPDRSLVGERYEGPGDELERKLCGIYAEVLQLKAGAVGVKDDFFRLGGNSILAMRLVGRINRELGTGVRVTAIFLHRTIRQLCNHLREGVSGEVRISAPAVNTVEEQALSFAQERLWFIENYEAGSRAYNIPMAVRLSGNVELESVVLALRSVVHRHEVLRTLIRTSREGIGYQQVMNDEDMPLEIGRVELSSEEDLQAELQREGSEIFRLDREYPIRLKMYRVKGETDWYLSIVLHHIAFDEWSGEIFLRELEQSYRYQEAVRLAQWEKAKEQKLPVPALQYREFALWQRGYLTGEVLERQVRYWHQKLAGYEPLRLATDRVRPLQVSHEGSTVYFELTPEVSEGLRGVARELEVSLYSVLLSGYYILLSAYSNQKDIIVGSAVANRHYGELSGLIGFFVNMLAMRERVEGDQEVVEFIRQVGHTVVEGQLHQDLPFEKLVEELQVEQDPSRHPVFQVTFGLEQGWKGAGREERLWQRYGGSDDLQVAKFDLSVMMEEREGLLRGVFNYATSLFDKETIRWYVETYREILGQIGNLLKNAAEHGTRIGELHYLGESEQAQLTGEWKVRDVTYASNRTIQSLFEEQVERTPDTTAVIYEGVALTYKELNERSNQLANYLLEQYNLQSDELVCLCLDRNEQLLIGILGVLKAGGAYVPMEPGSPEERLEYIMQDTGSKVVLRGALPDVSDCSDINPQTKTGADNLAYVIYTSGTTGKPKGVMVEHRQVARLFSATEEWYYFTSEDVWTLFHSYVFDFSVWEIWGALLYGGRLVVVGEEQRLDPVLFYEMCKDHGVTVLNQTPSAFYPWMEVAVGRSERLEKLRYIIFGGEALNPGQLRPWFDHYGEWGPKVINMYGITETTVHVTYQEITGAELNRGSLIGQPIGDLSAYVLDAAGRLLPIGAIGELYVGGAGVARGYLNRSALTAERFVSNRFQTEDEKRLGINDRLYRTGDLVRWRTDGNLEYLGRNDQQVKLRGYRIELGEIESRLSSYPGVRQSVVVMKGEATDHPYLVGYYVSEKETDEEILLQHLRAGLPDYMVPSLLMWLQQLPLTVNGKVDRQALPFVEFNGSSRYEAPANWLEEKLCNIYAAVLGLNAEEIGVHDDFFRLGGDSIIAIRLVSKINQELQKELSVRDVFELKSIRPIGNLLMNSKGAAIQGSYKPFSLTEAGKYAAADMEGVTDIYPASYLQIGMLLESKQGVKGTYHDVFRYRINAVFEEERFVRLIRQLVNKHELLRAKFLLSDNGYDCVIQEETDLEIRVVENEDPEPIIEGERFNDFDFRRAGLFRMVVNRMPEQYDLIFSFHHAITDGWSVASLINEFITAYTGGRDITGKVRLHYGEFIANERQWLKNVEAENFWKGYLSGSDAGHVRWKNGTTVRPESDLFLSRFRLEEERARAVHQLAHSLQVTVDSVFLFVYIHTLSRFLNQEDITIGLVTNNRIEKEDGDKLFGLFLNTVPYRYQVKGHGEDHKAAIADVFDEKLKLYHYKGYPYGKIKSLMGRELYQFAFNFVHFHIYANSRKDITGGSGYERTSIPFVFTVFQDGDSGFSVALRGHEEVADQEPLDAFMRHFEYHLNGLIEGKADFTQIPEAEQTQLLKAWKDSAVKYASNRTIQSLFEEQVERTPDTTAVIYDSVALTYKELNERSNQLANYLLEQYNLQPDELVCLCLDRNEQLLIGILGVLKAGGAYVPMEPGSPEERLEYIMQDTGSKVVLRGALPDVSDYSDINPQTKTGADNLAYVIYTSGTTGKPKGVMVEHRQVARLFSATEEWYYFTSEDVWTLFHSYVFDFSVWEIWGALLYGGRLVVVGEEQRRDPVLFYEMCKDHGVTVLNQTPSAFYPWMEVAVGRSERLEKLSYIIFGGEALNPGQLRPWFDHYGEWGPKVINMYGITETTVHVTYQEITGAELNRGSLIGQPIGDLSAYVLDAAGRLLPIGAIGELYVGGAGVARGYLNRSALTAERFVSNRFQTEDEKRLGINDRLYRTGDLVRWRTDGNLEYLGRNDQQVKLRGYRIELGEIESRLSSYPGVRQSVVVMKGEATDHPYLVGYYVSDGAVNEEELLPYLSAVLPDYMVPSALMRLEVFPVTVNGKLDRDALPEPKLTNASRYEAPGNELEQKLCAIYGEVLGLKAEEIGVHDDFFRLGGDSIIAIRLVSKINQELQKELSVRDVFELKSIRPIGNLLMNTSEAAVDDSYQPFSLIDKNKYTNI